MAPTQDQLRLMEMEDEDDAAAAPKLAPEANDLSYAPVDPVNPDPQTAQLPSPPSPEPAKEPSFREWVMQRGSAAGKAIEDTMRAKQNAQDEISTTIARGALKGTMGEYAPKAAAGIANAIPALAPESTGEGYEGKRSEYQKAYSDTQAESPVLFGASEVGASVGRDMLLPGSALAQGVVGAGLAAAEDDGDLLSFERGTDAVRGGLMGFGGAKVGGKLGEKIADAAPKFGTWLKGKARNNAIRSVNPTKADIRQMDADGTMTEYADYMLGEGPSNTQILKPFMSVEDVSARLGEAADESGKRVGSAIGKIDAAVPPTTRLLGNKVHAVPVPNYEGYDFSKELDKQLGAPLRANPLRKGGSADNYVTKVRDEFENYGGTLEGAHNLKHDIAKDAKFNNLIAPEKSEAARSTYGIYNTDHENKVLKAAAAGGDAKLGIDYLTAKADYAPAIQMGMVADKGAAAKLANRSIAPSSYGSLLGATTAPAKAALMGVNQVALERGSPTLAVGLNSLSKSLPPQLANSPQFLERWGGILGKGIDPIVADRILTKSNPEYAADRAALMGGGT